MTIFDIFGTGILEDQHQYSEELRFASDDKSYLPYALERLLAHPRFQWLAAGPKDWMFRPFDWPPTRYETKAIKGPPVFLRFARTANVTA